MNTNQIKFSSDFNPNFIGSNINEYLKKTEEQLKSFPQLVIIITMILKNILSLFLT